MLALPALSAIFKLNYRKTSTAQIFFVVWLQSDNELPMSEMQKSGGHRLRFRNKARGKLPQF